MLIREGLWKGEREDYLLFYHTSSITQKNLKVFLSGSLSFTRAKGKGLGLFCCVYHRESHPDAAYFKEPFITINVDSRE